MARVIGSRNERNGNALGVLLTLLGKWISTNIDQEMGAK